MTRLFVRRYFDRRLSEEVSRARRHDATFSLMLVDLDDFKQVNDRYGHAAGDMVLRKVAEVLLGEVRSLDIPARVGGDEMAVICPEVGWQGAKVLAERILSRLRGEGVTVEGVRLEISVSIGLASYREHCAAGGREIMAVADEALYRAKSGGKGMLVVAGE